MKVKFLPSGEEHEIEFNETILHLAQRCGLHIQSVCKGLPSCAECRIQLVEGEHHVLPPSKKELSLIGTAHYVDLSRLSCQLRCFGDVTVDLSGQIEKEKRVREKPADLRVRKDGEKSKAVLGGILDDVVSDDVDLTETKTSKKEKVEVTPFSGKPNLDKKNSFYGSFYGGKSKDTSENRKKTSQSGNRNRNRNRNRNENGNGNKSKKKITRKYKQNKRKGQ